MKRAFTLLLLFLCFLADARADVWSNAQYRCELTMPEGESWGRNSPQLLSMGEMIFSATYKPLEQNIAVVVVPNIPSGNLKNPGIVNRILEAITSMGFAVSSQKIVTFNDEPYLEILGRRDEGLGPKLVCVARATLQEGTIYIAATSGNGGEERSKDTHFLRVLNSFRIVDATVKKTDPTAHPLFHHYRLAYRVCGGGAVGLLGLGLLVVIFSRRKE